MGSFAIREVRTIAAVLVLSLALATPSTGFAQRSQQADDRQARLEAQIEREPQSSSSVESSLARPRAAPQHLAGEEWQGAIERLQDEISAAQAEAGPNAADLIGSFAALGALYQESGDYVLAAAALRRAVDLVRYNYGLHSLQQAPLVRQLIATMKAVGDAESAWDLEQELLALAERHPDDLRTARILRETADRRMDILRRYSAGEWPPEIVLGCYYDISRDGNCAAGSRRQVKRRLLGEAQSYYAGSINVLLRNERFGSEELRALLMELVESSFRYGTPNLGARSLHYLLVAQITSEEPWLTRIKTLVQIADWELLYSNGRNEAEEAIAAYEQAYVLLEEMGVARTAIEQIFSPSTPVVLPAFSSNPLASLEPRDGGEHVDVAFEVTKYGEARRVRILETTSGATRADERQLKELISRSRFRPRTTNGEFDDVERVVARYHVGE